MILKRHLENQNSFKIIEEDAISKQDLVDGVIPCFFKTKNVKLVAQEELGDQAAYLIEDENGKIHKVGFAFYVENKISNLMLPEIELPKPNMPLAEAISTIVNYASEFAKNKMSDYPDEEPTLEMQKAGQILGRNTTTELFNVIVNIHKARQQA